MVLSDFADACYKVDNVYTPDHEGGLLWNDHDVGVDWPNDNPILSEKNEEWPTLKVN